jgi:hypothetical protein
VRCPLSNHRPISDLFGSTRSSRSFRPRWPAAHWRWLRNKSHPEFDTRAIDGCVELQAALEASKDVKPRVVHDHGGEFVNRDVAAVIKAHNLIDIKTKPRHPE